MGYLVGMNLGEMGYLQGMNLGKMGYLQGVNLGKMGYLQGMRGGIGNGQLGVSCMTPCCHPLMILSFNKCFAGTGEGNGVSF